MKHTILFLTLILFAMTAAAFAQGTELPPHWKFGHATLYQIEDTASGFAPGTFPTVDQATFDKYATDGRIPSTVSAFLLEYPPSGKFVLIDATMGNGGLTANLGKAMGDKFEPEKVALVLITHLHGDHIAGLLDGEARRFPNANVFCSKPEYEHWVKQNSAAVERVKKAYGDDFRGGFEFDEAVGLPGGDEEDKVTVTPLNAVGHTPGHTVFLIESSGEKLMVVGDLLHAAALQFPMPEVCASFDMDKTEAVKARRRILDLAAEENILIAGIHFPKPGIGYVKKNADGYEFVPIQGK